MKRIYLAGWSKEFAWRKKVQEKYYKSFDFVDPITETNTIIEEKYKIPGLAEQLKYHKVKLTEKIKTDIVEIDKELIIKCDILLAYIRRKTFGTSMELIFAHHNDIPVYVVNPGLTYLDDPWMTYHCKEIFSNTDDAFKHLCKTYLFESDKKELFTYAAGA